MADKMLPNTDLVHEDDDSYTFRMKNKDGDATDITASKAAQPSFYRMLKYDAGDGGDASLGNIPTSAPTNAPGMQMPWDVNQPAQITPNMLPVPDAPMAPQDAGGMPAGGQVGPPAGGSMGPPPSFGPPGANGPVGSQFDPSQPGPFATPGAQPSAPFAVQPPSFPGGPGAPPVANDQNTPVTGNVGQVLGGGRPAAAGPPPGAGAGAGQATGGPPRYMIPMTTAGTSSSQTTANPLAFAAAKPMLNAWDQLPNDEKKALQAQNALDMEGARLRLQYSNWAANEANNARTRLQQTTDAQMNDYQKLLAQRQGMHVDANRMFGDGQTGNKIWAALALGLGAMGQAFSGHDYNSSIMGMITGAINRDIDVQKTNISNVDSQVANKRGMLEDSLKVANNMQAATEATRIAGLNYVQDKIAQMRASPAYANPIMKAQLDQLSIQTGAEVTKAASTLGSSTAQKNEQTQQHILPTPDAARETKYEDLAKQREAVAHLKAILPAYLGLKQNADGSANWDGTAGEDYLKQHWQDFKNKFGLQNGNEADVRRTLKTLTAGTLEELGGARALNPSEFKNLQDIGISLAQPPGTIQHQIARYESQLHNEAYNMARTDWDNGVRAPDPDVQLNRLIGPQTDPMHPAVNSDNLPSYFHPAPVPIKKKK